MGVCKHLFLHLFLGTAPREKSEQPPSSCRQSGDIKSCGSPWRRKAGRSLISRWGVGCPVVAGAAVRSCSREKGVPGAQQCWMSAPASQVSSLPVPGGIALQSSEPRGPHKRTDQQAGGLVALRATAAVLKNQVLQGSVSFPKAGPVLAAGAAAGTGAVGPWCWGLQGGMCWWRVSVPGCEWSLSAPGEPEQHLSDPGRQLV